MNHLPECPAAAECRCEPDHYGHYPTCPKVYCVCKFHRKGYAAGLDAAREAVVAKALHSSKCLALLPAFNERDCNCACAYALAAIDALREKS